MQIKCAISGLEFVADYISFTAVSRELTHPIFSLPQKTIFSLAIAQDENTPIQDTYLLFCALLNSTDLIQWRSPARPCAISGRAAFSHLPGLIGILARIDIIKNRATVLPQLAITAQNNDFRDVGAWISAVNTAIDSWLDGYARELREIDQERQEAAISKLIRDPNKPKILLAKKLAGWAARVAGFPTAAIKHPITKQQVRVTDYWQELIVHAHNARNAWNYPTPDYRKLIDWCIDNIEHGNIYSHALLELLRNAAYASENYLAAHTEELSVIELSRREQIKMVAPTAAPSEKDYKSKFEYMKALAAWKLASKSDK